MEEIVIKAQSKAAAKRALEKLSGIAGITVTYAGAVVAAATLAAGIIESGRRTKAAAGPATANPLMKKIEKSLKQVKAQEQGKLPRKSLRELVSEVD